MMWARRIGLFAGALFPVINLIGVPKDLKDLVDYSLDYTNPVQNRSALVEFILEDESLEKHHHEEHERYSNHTQQLPRSPTNVVRLEESTEKTEEIPTTTDSAQEATNQQETSQTTAEMAINPPVQFPSDPDIFDPNMSLEDYASSPSSWPTDNWLKSCAASLQNDTNLVVPFPDSKEWNQYALGDCIKRCYKCNYGISKREWVNWQLGKNRDITKLTKMAHMYYRLSCPVKSNLDAVEKMFQIVQEREGFHKPDPNAVVLHLRLGDVVEFQPAETDILLTSGGVGHHPSFKKWKIKSIRSLHDYLNLINRVNGETKKVIIVGGSHKAMLYKKSRVYAHCLQRGLAKAGKQVEMYLDNGNADTDFYFMSHAKYFIASTGGYSRYLGRLAQRFGGKVVFADGTDEVREANQTAAAEVAIETVDEGTTTEQSKNADETGASPENESAGQGVPPQENAPVHDERSLSVPESEAGMDEKKAEEIAPAQEGNWEAETDTNNQGGTPDSQTESVAPDNTPSEPIVDEHTGDDETNKWEATPGDQKDTNNEAWKGNEAAGNEAIAENWVATQPNEASNPAKNTDHVFDPATFDPDVFDPRMTLDHYALVEPAWPTEKWLTSCAASLQNDTSLVVPFPDSKQWNAYALGDCIKRCMKCRNGVSTREWIDWDKHHDVAKLSRLAHMYFRLSCPNDKSNMTKVEELFDVVGNWEGFNKPDPEAAVLHLRLGDVVEFQPRMPDHLLIKGGTGNHPSFKKRKLKSIRSIYTYLRILDTISSETKNKVIIVGGSHKPQLYEKSRVYAHCLQRGLARAGKKTEMYLDGGNADKDFYFNSHAKYYIASTGGYSRQMGRLAERGGGKVVYADGWDEWIGGDKTTG